MAFIMAAKLSYKAAIPEAGPVLLEPIGTLKAHVPADNTGDIMGEVTKRRGRVLGMNPDEDGEQVVEAEVPMSEMQDFTTFLRQLTQGRGWFTFDFVRYETLPPDAGSQSHRAGQSPWELCGRRSLIIEKKRTGAKEGVRKTVSVPAVMSAGTVLVYIVAI